MKKTDIRKLVHYSSEAAASMARIDQINEILQQNQRESTLGFVKAYADDLTADLTSLKSKAIAEHRQASAEAFRLDIQLQAEGMAKAAGSINPELTANVIAQQARILRDTSGELYYKIKDISSGVEGDIPFALERLSKNPDYSVLFNEANQRPEQKTVSIPSVVGSEVNPWHKKTLNLTQQGNILLSDPQKAERLKREAGLN
jgi:hypothetical protein